MNNIHKIFSVFVIIFISLLFSSYIFANTPYDLIIKNGSIIGGSGDSSFNADIGIRDGKIVKVGIIEASQAEKVIDATNLTVCPGFIDIHTHCDGNIDNIPTVHNYVHQGVTSVIGGNCGGHPFPLQQLFRNIEDNGIAINFGCLIGHNTIRRKVMGYSMEAPTDKEIEQMKILVYLEMKAGALGLSTGLAYLPGIYSDNEEIIELASIVSIFGGIYASHIRDQGVYINESIKEAIEVGEKNNIPVQISHIKLADDAVWNELEKVTEPVEKARNRGVQVTLDQYPYTATSSGFTSSFPSWCFEGGRQQFLNRLKDETKLRQIKLHIRERRLLSKKGINKLETIYIANYPKNSNFEGKNLKQILLEQGKKPSVANALNLIIEIEKNGGASGVFFQMDEKDVEDFMKLPYVMHASDGGIRVLGSGVPHPRNYGTFPRIIGYYVREKKVISLEEAVRKMTSLPASVLGLKKRGLIHEGMYADITIFDKDKFKDKATYSKPHQYSTGLHYVIVNGKIVLYQGQLTGAFPGVILYGKGKKF
ncbi:MAG: N-acyl-D-amino-acid deacylase family protein [Candidatus Aminicenantaceae bacterium]